MRSKFSKLTHPFFLWNNKKFLSRKKKDKLSKLVNLSSNTNFYSSFDYGGSVKHYKNRSFDLMFFGTSCIKRSYRHFYFTEDKTNKAYPLFSHRWLGCALIFSGFFKTWHEVYETLYACKVFVNGKVVSNFKKKLFSGDFVIVQRTFPRFSEKIPMNNNYIVVSPISSSFIYLGFGSLFLVPSLYIVKEFSFILAVSFSRSIFSDYLRKLEYLPHFL